MPYIRAIEGVSEVIKNLKKRHDALAKGCERGLKLAGLHLLRESQMLVPVDYGVLKASGFARPKGKGFATNVMVGYTAYYAIFVHENVEEKLKGQPRPAPHKGNYWDPQGRGRSKFLEHPARTQARTIRRIIKENTRIRK